MTGRDVQWPSAPWSCRSGRRRSAIDEALPLLLALLRREGLAVLPWRRKRCSCGPGWPFCTGSWPEEGWPDVGDAALLSESRRVAGRVAGGGAEPQRPGASRPGGEPAGAWLGRRGRELERLAPERLAVPSGSRVRLDYAAGDSPVLAAKLQELFGLADTPRLAGGRVPVLIHLLSPAGRPLAVTRDLRSFWDTVYPEVKKGDERPLPEAPLARRPVECAGDAAHQPPRRS